MSSIDAPEFDLSFVSGLAGSELWIALNQDRELEAFVNKLCSNAAWKRVYGEEAAQDAWRIRIKTESHLSRDGWLRRLPPLSGDIPYLLQED